MAAILAGPKRMVNADGAIACDSAAPCGARMAADRLLLAPERSTPDEGKRPFGQPSQRSQWFSISRVKPLLILFFPFQIDVFFQKVRLGAHTR